MANYRKVRALKRELGELDQQKKDFMENLANSLLEIQNSASIPRPEMPENEKTPASVQVTTTEESNN